MAHKNIDRCKETTSTTGPGTLTLTGAVSGFVAVADATAGLTVDGDTGWFEAINGAEWEIFLGTRVDATHLARTTVISSSNAGAAVSFTAAPIVFSTVPGAKVSAVGPSFSAYRATSNQTLTSGAISKVQLNAEDFDTGNCFDSTTNYRFQPNVGGYYQVSGSVNVSAASGMANVQAQLYKNGASIAVGNYVPGVSTNATVATNSKLVYMNGTTDYLELWIYANGTSPAVAFGSATFLTAYLAALPGAPLLAPIVAPGPSVSAYRATSNQSVTASTWTKIALNAEAFDTGNCFDSTTNYQFRPNVEGYYLVSFSVTVTAASGLVGATSAVYKNGAAHVYGGYAPGVSSVSGRTHGTGLIHMNGTTDYLELWGYGAGTSVAFTFSAGATFMSAHLAALPQVPQPTVGPAFSAYRSTDQTGLTNATYVKVNFDAEEFDTNGCFDSTTNYRFTPNVAGYYSVSWCASLGGTALTNGFAVLYKNGVLAAEGSWGATASSVAASTGSLLVYMNGTTDYLEVFAYTVATSGNKAAGGAGKSHFSAHFVRA